jgi:nitrile hydratase
VVPSGPALRAKALESLLVEKGLVDRAALDALVDTYEHKVGPRNGARVVARAWTDPAFKQRLLENGTATIAELGYSGEQGADIRVVENTPRVHNLVVCTLCSCYPWPVLGLPPVWYKSAPYRSRAVIDPRGVLREFGTELAEDVEVRVWDSTADERYLVLPERPTGTEKLSEEELSTLVTRDAMIGVAHDRCGKGCTARGRQGMNGVHDMGGMQDFGPMQPEKNEPVFHEPWEGRVLAMIRAVGATGKLGGFSRAAIENIPPAEYLRMSYYERFLTVLVERLIGSGLVTRQEIESGKPAKGSSKFVPALRPAEAATSSFRTAPAVSHPEVSPHFYAGDRVRARMMNPKGHTRLPRYARGRLGVIARDQGVQLFPDMSTAGLGQKPQHVYSVRFAAQELWGAEASAGDSVYIDLWEDYLEPA